MFDERGNSKNDKPKHLFLYKLDLPNFAPCLVGVLERWLYGALENRSERDWTNSPDTSNSHEPLVVMVFLGPIMWNLD